MNSEDLNNIMSTLELAINNGALNTSTNEKRLQKILKNMSKSCSKIHQEETRNKKFSFVVDDAVNSTIYSESSATNNAITTSTSATSAATSTDSTDGSDASSVTCSDLISITNNQPPSEMFVCDEQTLSNKIKKNKVPKLLSTLRSSGNDHTNFNLALTEYTTSDGDDSDQIIVLK